MIKSVLVMGGGSAGFLAAITIKKKLPHLSVTVIHSKAMGVIGVGEGTTLTFPRHIHGYLGTPMKEFFDGADPIWKVGIRFLWGRRRCFDFPFLPQMEVSYDGMTRETGYFCDESEMEYAGLMSGLMSHEKVFERGRDGRPLVRGNVGYHLENRRLVVYLEEWAARLGVDVRDDVVKEVLQDDRGITGLRLDSNPQALAAADLYIDCSGFGSALLGKALGESFVPFKSSLLCDRAVWGGWTRAEEERIQPYTKAETMDAGWCWQIDHRHLTNRGYVYCSSFMSDGDAEAELRRKNPKVGATKFVKFLSGRYERSWVKNVVAIGNASGFVEPLEATSLGRICSQSRLLVESLIECDLDMSETTRSAYSRNNARIWDAIRSFLSIHYRFNTRLDTPFWQECRRSVELCGAAEFVEYYREVGPCALVGSELLDSLDPFGSEGYLTLLVGQQVPFQRRYVPAAMEAEAWECAQAHFRKRALEAFDSEEVLRLAAEPGWRWPDGIYPFGDRERAITS